MSKNYWSIEKEHCAKEKQLFEVRTIHNLRKSAPSAKTQIQCLTLMCGVEPPPPPVED